MLRRVAFGFIVALILTLTLTPASPDFEAPLLDLGLMGFRDVADGIANVLLFVPFGAAAAAVFGGWRAGVLGALALSVSIEIAQLLVPGRYTSPSDVVFNTLGGAVGVLLVHRPDLWLRPAPRPGAIMSWAALAAALLVLLGGTRLFAPSVTERPLFGQWAPDRSPDGRYPGRILTASVGDVHVPWGRIVPTAEARRHLLRGDTVRVVVEVAPAPRWRMPILSIVDGDVAVLTLAAERDDLVLSYRMRAARIGLDQPDLRLTGALRDIPAGARAELSTWREDRLYCLAVGDTRRCGLGFSPGQTWSLLLYPLPLMLAAAMRFVWIAVLLAPAGFWCVGRGQLALLVVLAAGALLTFPFGIAARPTPPEEIAVAAVALVLAHALRRFVPVAAAADAGPDGLPGAGPLEAAHA